MVVRLEDEAFLNALSPSGRKRVTEALASEPFDYLAPAGRVRMPARRYTAVLSTAKQPSSGATAKRQKKPRQSNRRLSLRGRLWVGFVYLGAWIYIALGWCVFKLSEIITLMGDLLLEHARGYGRGK